MNIHVQTIQASQLVPHLSLTVATLDVPYHDFIALESGVARPSRTTGMPLRLRVRLTRPDGTQLEPFASIPLVSGQNAPARLILDDLAPADAPAGTEISLLRYEPDPTPPPSAN